MLADVAATGGTYRAVAEPVAGAGIVVLAAAIAVRLPGLVPWAVGATGAGYLIGRAHHATADGWAAVVGAGLLLAAELASWSIGEDRRIRAEPGVAARRALLLGVVVAASGLTGAFLVAAAAVSTPAGVALSAIGTAAAVGALALILRLLRGERRGGAGIVR